jgi:alkylation response protein AidB-like acyl-CoA dehydrogenase
MAYRPPLRDYSFLLRHVLNADALPAFQEVGLDVIEQMLGEAGRIAAEVLAPLNRVGDEEGCRWSPDFSVKTPTGFAEAYRTFAAGGWPGVGSDPAFGGQGLPQAVGLMVTEMCSAANMAFTMYQGLTHGAYSAIRAGGSEAQKALYLPKLVSGEWAGSMNLTEPHCGTDLGLLRTQAVPQEDGTYRITGQKIWISGGEHDLTENIVHLVLARTPGAPAGTAGISLFLVPKFIPDADGAAGVRNSVRCLGLEEKMGIHGNATCVMSYEDATGWLVGEENRGLAVMFVMMNYERLGAGMQGVGQAEAAYQSALDFARERLQGRAIGGARNPDGPADPIIVHPDIRRLLMNVKAFVEGSRALIHWTALQADLEDSAADDDSRNRARGRMALMTPIVKAFLTDRGFQACSEALQVHGGAGYTEHFPVSQYLRDARIAQIYEGANGIQALDLVSRKLSGPAGRAIDEFIEELEAFGGARASSVFGQAVSGAAAQLREATDWLRQRAATEREATAASASDYLHLFGLTATAYMWGLMADAAQARLDSGETDPFYAAKLVTGRHFVERVLPEAAARLAAVKAGAGALMELPADSF